MVLIYTGLDSVESQNKNLTNLKLNWYSFGFGGITK